MRLLPRSLKWRSILLTLVGLVSVGVSVWVVFGKRIRDSVENQLAVLRKRDDPNPMVQRLARGEIRAGSSVEELIAAHPPQRVIRHGRYVDVFYPNSVEVVAVDGRLAFARHGMCGATIFFDRLSDEGWEEFSCSSSADYDRRMAERMNAYRAVGGVIGYAQYCSPMSELPSGVPECERP